MNDQCESVFPRSLLRISRSTQSTRMNDLSTSAKMVTEIDSNQNTTNQASKRSNSSSNANVNGSSVKKVKDDTPSRILTVDLIAEKFSRMQKNLEQPLNPIYYSDESYQMIWSFKACSSANGSQESLSFTATCNPDMNKGQQWYNIVDFSLIIKPVNPDLKPLARKKIEIISSQAPDIVFDDIESMKSLRDANKGYLTPNDELQLQVHFEKHMLFEFIPLTCVRESFWLSDSTFPAEDKCYWTVSRLISLLFNCSKRSDVKIKTADGIIPAHKFVLANFSPVLDREIYENGKDEIDLTSVSRKAVLVLLNFFYRHEFIFSEDLLLDVYDTAVKLGCIDISAFCLYILTPQVVSRVLCDSFETSTINATSDLIERSNSILLSTIDHFAEKDLIKLLQRDQIQSILMCDDLKISEFLLYQHCERWAQAECIRKGVEASAENKQEIFGPLKYLFHFSEMSTTEFRDGPRAGDLLTQDDKIEILLHVFSGDDNPSRFTSSKRRQSPVQSIPQ